MLILTCCYLFLYFFAVIPCSPSMLWFSFPTLTPAVWLNQSDRLWVPGEGLSLSTVPFLLKFTLSVTNSFWHLSKCSALCWTDLYGLFTLAHAYTPTLSAQTLYSTCSHKACTDAHTGACRDAHKHMWKHKCTQNVVKKQDAQYPQGTHIMPHTRLP